MNCWSCGRFMAHKIQATIPRKFGFWYCRKCDTESCKPGESRKAFKSGWAYIAGLTSYLFWDGQASDEDDREDHYTEIPCIDHGAVTVSCP